VVGPAFCAGRTASVARRRRIPRLAGRFTSFTASYTLVARPAPSLGLVAMVRPLWSTLACPVITTPVEVFGKIGVFGEGWGGGGVVVAGPRPEDK
jgi:hypothetical protein